MGLISELTLNYCSADYQKILEDLEIDVVIIESNCKDNLRFSVFTYFSMPKNDYFCNLNVHFFISDYSQN